MQPDQNSEFTPDQGALSPTAEGAIHTGTGREGGARGLLLTGKKAAELSQARAQREAVLKIVKDDLASKLNSFYILYYIVLLVSCAAIALRIVLLPSDEGWGYLAFFFIANGVYFTFVMLLSLSYELYLRVGWHASLAAAALILLFPKIQPYLTVSRPLISAASVAAAMLLLFGIGFLRRAAAGKRLRAALKELRRGNRQKNENRNQFVSEAVEFLSRDEPKARFPRRTVRRFVRESAAGVAFSIKEDSQCLDKVESLEEFVKQHRLRDAFGRLAVAVGVASALAYAVFPLSDVAEAVSHVALKVLPVYGAALFVMDRFDEAREVALGELQRVIDPGLGKGANPDRDALRVEGIT